MSYFMVDVESDGPIPGDYSLVCFAAVVVESTLTKTFYSKVRPISENWDAEALSISGFSREQHLSFDDPKTEMQRFHEWVRAVSTGSPQFVSDNNGYDWSFINWYFHHFIKRNPFGYSSTNLGSLYKGLVRDCSKNFKHLRKTPHTHNPTDDVVGNAEALLTMSANMGLNISLV